jgi:hypothetical protein
MPSLAGQLAYKRLGRTMSMLSDQGV